MSFAHENRARTPRKLIIIAVIWAVVLGLYIVLDASWILVLLTWLATLPALYEMWLNKTASLCISEQEISWSSGRYKGRIAAADIAMVRLDTRLDFSLKMTLIGAEGGRLRLPFDVVPKAGPLEAALKTHGYPYQRHHFALLN